MMVLKFEDFIKEGVLSKTIYRSKSGEKRIENKFLESDISKFNFTNHNIYSFLKENDIYDLYMNQFPNKFNEVYEDFIIKHGKTKGLLDIGFEDDDCDMPDFEWSFEIERLKHVQIYIEYINQNKEINIFCGNNKPEFDISETTFGRAIQKSFKKFTSDIIEKHSDIIIDNLKDNWELFEKLLYECVYESCLKDFKYDLEYHHTLSKIDGIEIIPDEYSTELSRFYFDTAYCDDNKVYIKDEHGTDISGTKEGQKILEIYKNAYDEALKNAKDYFYDKHNYINSEYVEEGILSKTLNRSKNNELRQEDKFTQNDINIFNYPKKYDQYKNFIKKYNINDEISKYHEHVQETYTDFILKYGNEHGLLDLGFEKDDCDMPDFNYSFLIKDIKNIKIFISFSNKEKKLSVFCGYNEKEFDITETSFGLNILNYITSIVEYAVCDQNDILMKNLKKNYELCKELLKKYIEEIVSNCCEDITNVYDFPNIADMEIIPQYSKNIKTQRFYISGIFFDKNPRKKPEIYLGDDFNITSTKEGQELIDITYHTFDKEIDAWKCEIQERDDDYYDY